MAFLKVLSSLLLIQLVAAAPTSPQYSKANSEFTSDFFHHITEGNVDKNVLVSPASVQSCMAMAYMGAKGATANEMVKGLHFTTSDKSEISQRAKKLFETLPPSLKIANRIYLEKNAKIKPEFNSLVKSAFKVEAENLDFSHAEESANIINKWVESNTNNKIKNLVSTETVEDAHMILVNAIHFKGEWVNKFAVAEKSDFWLNENSKTQADMMQQTESFKYAEIKELDAKAIEMPYTDSGFSMMIILPNKRDGLEELEHKLKDTDLMKTASQLTSTKVHLVLPKYEFEYEIQLNDVLKKMDMTTMFSDVADFSDLSDTKTKISEVVHKAFIKVDENGSEAAAATFIKTVNYSLAVNVGPPKEFIADHPFVFAIKDTTGIFFVGHVATF